MKALVPLPLCFALAMAVALFLPLRLSAGAAPAEGVFTGKCVGVPEGDLLQVMRNGYPEYVRLAGVDAPELKQSFGLEAKRGLSSLAFLKPLRIQMHGRDSAGAILAVVVVTSPTLELNATLVRNGLAWRDPKTSDTRLATLQALARREERGLWREVGPTPPWEFRRQARESADKDFPEAPMNGPNTVYVTKIGTSYHRKDCIALRNWIAPVFRSDAIKHGYTPCFLCEPDAEKPK